ncbi:ASCH domain-containing protein [Chitinophaga solisilvae]|uniref:ASCH domain-containing protein n=1 Tax=Chitinophaga solisilvae TaxID=1233460 RepID=UPI00136F4DF9|nr:ASCH domain-containing protein [Chitinophaga solisilvae]
MLFKQEHLEGIRSGKVSLAFRKWNKPSAKQGSAVKTSVGIVEITAVTKTTAAAISEKDARNAGFSSLAALRSKLDKYPAGDIYRIAVQYKSPDPRLELREQTSLSAAQLAALKTKLERLDAYSKQGAWTTDILLAIKNNPLLKAASLALLTGKEKDWLKINIRKLKNLGLTISHDPGYTISPLGERLLEYLII